MVRSRPLFLALLVFGFLFSLRCFAQAPVRPDAADIRLALEKLRVLGSVLYVAAHPDDENTRLIAYLAKGRLLNTAYLSLTRGDGGQNLIGPEIREELGLIRTQELLQARRTDGGQQFFTRANDFGFSKDSEETLQIWDREQVLADMVWVIRKFRPDVIITRFSPEPGGTHGHHTASAILAVEAFQAAADPNRFPDQLQHVAVWQPKRLLWNTSSFFYGPGREFDSKGKITLDVGGYNPVLGKSYSEIAAESRSMHKSQGFGSSGSRGPAPEYLEHLAGQQATDNFMAGVDLSWSRVPGGKQVDKFLQKALRSYEAANPAAVVPLLLQVQAAIRKLPDNHWKKVKMADLQEVIRACLGLYVEATAQNFAVSPGDRLQVRLEAVNRSTVPVVLQSLMVEGAGKDSVVQKTLANNEPVFINTRVQVPRQMPYTHPYWLREPGSVGMFAVPDQQLVGLPQNPPALTVALEVLVQGEPISFEVPVVYKRTDPVEGEQYRPLEITPPVFVNLADKVVMFADQQPKLVQVVVEAGKPQVQGTVSPTLPAGWRAEPASLPFALNRKGDEMRLAFTVIPPQGQAEGQLLMVARVGEQTYSQGRKLIRYTHFPDQTIFPEAEARVVKLDLKRKGELIGYIMGAGDEGPQNLSQIGYQVEVLRDEQLSLETLRRFDAVVVGVRAYNTQERLRIHQPKLMQYVQEGGTLIVQYNVSGGLVTNELGPYPLKLSRDRVTKEDATVTILQPNHPVLNTPNKITQEDFKGWVQERGLYFPGEWSPEYTALLSAHDPGESPKEGGLLVAKYGKGHFVYTGYSFFRQLPAGVPGAYRLFTNLLSLGK